MSEQKTHAEIIARMRSDAEEDEYTPDGILGQTLHSLADSLEAAHKREVDALRQRCTELNAEVAAKDGVIKRLNDAIAEEQRHKMATAENPSVVGNAGKLREADHNWDAICAKCLEGEPPEKCRYYGEPNGCNSPIYGEHPKPFGENSAVLRSAIIEILLEMDDMSGLEVGRKYRFSPYAIAQQCRDALAAPARECDVGTADEQAERFENFCLKHIGCAEETGGKHCVGCPLEKASDNITQKCELYWAQLHYESEAAK